MRRMSCVCISNLWWQQAADGGNLSEIWKRYQVSFNQLTYLCDVTTQNKSNLDAYQQMRLQLVTTHVFYLVSWRTVRQCLCYVLCFGMKSMNSIMMMFRSCDIAKSWLLRSHVWLRERHVRQCLFYVPAWRVWWCTIMWYCRIIIAWSHSLYGHAWEIQSRRS